MGVSLRDKPTEHTLYKLSLEQTVVQVLSYNKDKGRDSSRRLGGPVDIPHRHRGRCQDRQQHLVCIPMGSDHLLYVGLDNSL